MGAWNIYRKLWVRNRPHFSCLFLHCHHRSDAGGPQTLAWSKSLFILYMLWYLNTLHKYVHLLSLVLLGSWIHRIDKASPGIPVLRYFSGHCAYQAQPLLTHPLELLYIFSLQSFIHDFFFLILTTTLLLSTLHPFRISNSHTKCSHFVLFNMLT